MRTDTGQVFRLEDYRPSDYLIPLTELDFRLSPEATRVTAVLTLERREDVAEGTPLVLDGDGLALVALEIDGKAAAPDAFEATPDRLTIPRPPSARRFRLTIGTEIDPSRNEALMGLYRSNGVYCTQCEAEGFRRITYFLDRPDILSVYTVRIEAGREEAPLLLSNGNPVEKGELDGGRHYAVWHDPFPKPSYLFALVAGDLGKVSDRFVTMSREARCANTFASVLVSPHSRGGQSAGGHKASSSWRFLSSNSETRLRSASIISRSFMPHLPALRGSGVDRRGHNLQSGGR